MIVIPAKVFCDRCPAETTVTLEVITNTENNTCVIEVYTPPKEWRVDHVYGRHLCPDHKNDY